MNKSILITYRQAIDASTQGIPLEKYAKTHKEQADSIKKFGIIK